MRGRKKNVYNREILSTYVEVKSITQAMTLTGFLKS